MPQLRLRHSAAPAAQARAAELRQQETPARRPTSGRLVSLDAFRGLAIVGMVLVNNPGSWEHTVPWLGHAPWHGWVFGDLIFPAFLVAVGVAMAYSLAGRPATRSLYAKVARRAGTLFVLGLLLNFQREPALADVRIMGILQRIAVAGLLAALVVLLLPRWGQVLVAVALLFGYWVAFTAVDVPGTAPGVLRPDSNLASHVDTALLGTRHVYNDGVIDPEGVVSSIPAVVSVLLGVWAGAWLRARPPAFATGLALALAGAVLLGGGLAWGSRFPINKQLWTSSYVLFTAGWALIALAALYLLIDVARQRWLAAPWRVLGANALLAYVGTAATFHVLRATPLGGGTVTWRDHLYSSVFAPRFGPLAGSYAFAVALLAAWWLVLVVLYRRRWLLRL
jgi:predicted acyltransferase